MHVLPQFLKSFIRELGIYAINPNTQEAQDLWVQDKLGLISEF